jgi:hypothetical protein
VLLVLSSIAATPVSAEDHNATANETPGDASAGIASPAGLAPAPVEVVALPDAPVPQKAKTRVIDKKFIAVMAALGGAESLRFTTHKLVLDNEYAAGAPWVTSVPPNQHLVLKFGAIYAGELLLSYELKKPHSWLPGDKFIRRLWWVPTAVLVPIHLKNGIRSIRTQAPAGTEGCPPEYQQYCGQ